MQALVNWAIIFIAVGIILYALVQNGSIKLANSCETAKKNLVIKSNPTIDQSYAQYVIELAIAAEEYEKSCNK